MGTILKQMGWLLSAQLFGRVIGFAYTIYLAKVLGVSEFGLFSAAMAYFSLATSVADFGFNRFLIREVARDRYKPSELLCDISLLRITITTVFFAVFAGILYIYDPDKIRVHLTLLAILAVLPQVLAQTLDSVFVALKKLKFSAIALVTLNITNILFGVLLVSTGYGAIGAVCALIIGEIIYAGLLLFLLHKRKISFLSAVKSTTLKEITFGSLPYGLLGVLGLLYFRIDTLLLVYLRGNFDAGIYTAAYKFLEALIVIPTALSAAIFPVMAKLHQEDLSKMREVYFKSVKLMGGVGILILLCYLVILPEVINKLLPGYKASIEVIKILGLAVPFMFIHAPGVQVLLSTDKYLKQIILLSFFTLGFNVLMNLVFIPEFGYLGAAWVTVASEVLSFFVFFLVIKRRVL